MLRAGSLSSAQTPAGHQCPPSALPTLCPGVHAAGRRLRRLQDHAQLHRALRLPAQLSPTSDAWPLTSHVSSVTHSRSVLRAFGLASAAPLTRTTTTFADFSLRQGRRAFTHKARSPRVRTHSFSAQPPDPRRLALITRASRFTARPPCSATPSSLFLYIGSELRSTLPPHTRSPSCSCASLR